MTPLILKRAPIGDNKDDYDVLENGKVVGRIFMVPTAPQGRPWMWASGHGGHIERAAHGYAETCEAAMAAFAKNRRRSGRVGSMNHRETVHLARGWTGWLLPMLRTSSCSSPSTPWWPLYRLRHRRRTRP